MNIKLKRPIAFLDVESTGLDTTKDRIVTLAVLKVYPTGQRAPLDWRFFPGVKMSPENIAIHGITNEMAAAWPRFEEHANDVHVALQDCDLGGFNHRNFDVPIIWEELYRCGITWDLAGVKLVDVGMIFKKKEPRDLSAGVEFYLGRKHEGAHSAMADTMATLEVFEAQTDGRHRYGDLAAMDIAKLDEFCNVERDGSRRLDLAGTIVRRADGVPVFGTKRNRGIPIEDDMGYASWILRSDFPAETRLVLADIVNQIHSNPAGQGGLL